MARLRVAPDQDLVAGVEEERPRADAAPLERPAHRREGDGHLPGPDVEHDCDELEAFRARGRSGPPGPAAAPRAGCRRNVSAKVLEELGRGHLAGPREAGEDHDVLLACTPPPGLPPGVVFPSRLPGRRHGGSLPRGELPPQRTRRIESSYRTYIVTPRTTGLMMSPPGVTTADTTAMITTTKRPRGTQARAGDDPDLRKQDEDDRVLHHEPEAQEQHRHEAEVAVRGPRAALKGAGPERRQEGDRGTAARRRPR